MPDKEKKTIELWDGYEVALSEQLLKDVDYITDYEKAAQDGQISQLAPLLVALVAGKAGENTEKVMGDIREHIVAEKGYFDIDSLGDILVKISDALPKGGNRAQKHSWQTSK